MYIRNNFASKKTYLATPIALLLFFLVDVAGRFYPQLHPDLIDGLRGFLLTLAIGTLAASAFKRRQR